MTLDDVAKRRQAVECGHQRWLLGARGQLGGKLQRRNQAFARQPLPAMPKAVP
jgi:hypothetical protein